jgi:hypothetical protein
MARNAGSFGATGGAPPKAVERDGGSAKISDEVSDA